MTDVSERAREVLRRQLPSLDAAAIPTKCETYVLCGRYAREVHDAIETVLAERDILAGHSVGEVERQTMREVILRADLLAHELPESLKPLHDAVHDFSYFFERGVVPIGDDAWSNELRTITPAPDSPAMVEVLDIDQVSLSSAVGYAGAVLRAHAEKLPVPSHARALADRCFEASNFLMRKLTPASHTAPPCTCHPDDRPEGACAQKYAKSECVTASHTALTDAIDKLSGIAQPSAGVLSIDQANALGVLIRHASGSHTAPDALRKALDERIANYSALRDQCVEAGTDENGYALAVEALERVRHDVFALATPSPSDRGEG